MSRSAPISRLHRSQWLRVAVWWLLAVAPFVTVRAEEALFAGSPFGPVVAAIETVDGGRRHSKGNQLALLEGGYDALLVRVHLIRQAKKSIEVQTFIWTNDECGRLIMCELLEAARRGVKVRIIADQLASERDPATIAFLATAHPNLEVRHYRPPMSRIDPSVATTVLAGLHSFHGVNQRMHNKVMLFDDVVLITGGRNIENTYFDHSTELNFRDRDVLVVGPVAREAVASFEEFWAFDHVVPSRKLTDVAAAIARGDYPRFERRGDFDFGPYFGALQREADDAELVTARFVSRLQPVEKVEFLCDRPGKSTGFFSRTARITRDLRHTLEQATNDVVIQTPYLILSKPAQQLIKDMQHKNPGLRIRISTNSFASTDNLMAYSANYRLRNAYVEDLGLEVHEFKPRPAELPSLFPGHVEMSRLAAPRIADGRQKREPFLCMHAKSLVVDDRLAFVGSYNLDPRSENLNTEAGLLIEDRAFAVALREKIERDLRAENSWVIARRALPLGMDSLNSVIGGLMSLSPVDMWPVRNTSSFDLRPGATEVPPGHPEFHLRYREIGSFPGSDGLLSEKEILTRLYKVIGTGLTPIL